MTRRPEFHTWLRAQMRRRKLTPEQLAAATGGQVSASLIYRWLKPDGVIPSETNLRRIADPLGVPYTQAMVAAGRLTAEDVAQQWADPADWEADPEQAIRESKLSRAQKDALIAHYRSYLPDTPAPPSQARGGAGRRRGA